MLSGAGCENSLALPSCKPQSVYTTLGLQKDKPCKGRHRTSVILVTLLSASRCTGLCKTAHGKGSHEQFKEFWLEGKVLQEVDYPIFFAVNQKPVKDNSGEYRYKRGPNGEPLMDKYGHVEIDHDLDEIAEAFVKFAKQQGYNFWRTE